MADVGRGWCGSTSQLLNFKTRLLLHSPSYQSPATLSFLHFESHKLPPGMLRTATLCTPSTSEEHGDQGNKEERERERDGEKDASSGKLKAFNSSTNTHTSTDNAASMGARAFMRVPRTAANGTDKTTNRLRASAIPSRIQGVDDDEGGGEV
ncbi:hypothetical protein B296_00030834 [Ensete ventricosum]|uniref:Uncharacterized protein n=1 Tax=Ensete ventricosum TaxID=4639 RepID=A0A426YPC8_ENSVE|nr:hypothetical protein B296_00030834 [Ensete ventricosum]